MAVELINGVWYLMCDECDEPYGGVRCCAKTRAEALELDDDWIPRDGSYLCPECWCELEQRT